MLESASDFLGGWIFRAPALDVGPGVRIVGRAGDHGHVLSTTGRLSSPQLNRWRVVLPEEAGIGLTPGRRTPLRSDHDRRANSSSDQQNAAAALTNACVVACTTGGGGCRCATMADCGLRTAPKLGLGAARFSCRQAKGGRYDSVVRPVVQSRCRDWF